MSVSLCVNFHSEGNLAHKSALSAERVANCARSRGVEVQLVSVLDKADPKTINAVRSSGVLWDQVISLEEGDLGVSRNISANTLDTDFIAFLDGDDLCGKDWILAAVDHWTSRGLTQAVLHPEYVYYFDEGDFDSPPEIAKLKSYWFKHVSSDFRDSIPDSLYWQNVYTSNFFTSRDFLVRNPLPKRCIDHGFGYEDWTWNLETLLKGVSHEVVEGTVHLVRITGRETLNLSNSRLGLLPDLDNHWALLHHSP